MLRRRRAQEAASQSTLSAFGESGLGIAMSAPRWRSAREWPDDSMQDEMIAVKGFQRMSQTCARKHNGVGAWTRHRAGATDAGDYSGRQRSTAECVSSSRVLVWLHSAL